MAALLAAKRRLSASIPSPRMSLFRPSRGSSTSGCLRTFPYDLETRSRLEWSGMDGFFLQHRARSASNERNITIGLDRSGTVNAARRCAQYAGEALRILIGRRGWQLGEKRESQRQTLRGAAHAEPPRAGLEQVRARFTASCSRAWPTSPPAGTTRRAIAAGAAGASGLRTRALPPSSLGIGPRRAGWPRSRFSFRRSRITPPSDGWARSFTGSGWLRHLRAAGSELSREQAKALVPDSSR